MDDTVQIALPLVKILRPMDLLGIDQRKCADVLIVDDNDFNRMILKMMLDKLGLTSEEAMTGLQAVKAVAKYRKNTFKLVIMDVEMPEMDGIEATRQICMKYQLGEISVIPQIIALTAYPASQLRDKCLAAGMREFFSKPLPMEKLQKVVRSYCGVRRGRHATF
jgi:CheY-like chemotaxis protein